MTVAVILLPVLVVALVAVYRNAQRTHDLSRTPFTLDREYGDANERVRAELETLIRIR